MADSRTSANRFECDLCGTGVAGVRMLSEYSRKHSRRIIVDVCEDCTGRPVAEVLAVVDGAVAELDRKRQVASRG